MTSNILRTPDEIFKYRKQAWKTGFLAPIYQALIWIGLVAVLFQHALSFYNKGGIEWMSSIMTEKRFSGESQLAELFGSMSQSKSLNGLETATLAKTQEE